MSHELAILLKIHGHFSRAALRTAAALRAAAALRKEL